MNNNNNTSGVNRALQAQIVAQWITSLAISVVCCAVLFIVFAGYIVDLHEKTNLLSVKFEVLQERSNQMQAELTALKSQPAAIPAQPTAAAAPAPAPDVTSDGVQLNEPEATKEETAPAINGVPNKTPQAK